jgi:hypothetical protein
MHLQNRGFEHFPVQQMEARLQHLGRADQLEDLRRRLANPRRSSPSSYFPDSLY